MIGQGNNGGVDSLWMHTAEPGPQLPRLEADTTAEVVIVGGGYSGLSAAHALAQRGIRPVVLDARKIGWGASGRNGGVVSAKFRISFPAIAQSYGLEMARRMHRIAHDSVDAVEQLVAEFDIGSAHFERTGHLRCAHTERARDTISAEAEWLRRELFDHSVSVLSREQVAQETGSQAFVGGVLTSDSGTIHPLNYVRGLAAGLAARKVDIFEDSPVEWIRHESGALLVGTPGGTVRAPQAIIATDAYSSLTPATGHFRRTIIPFRTAIIATERLPSDIERKLMIGRRSYTETRRMMKWFRKVDGRVVFGGRGAFGMEDTPAAFDALQRAMVDLFPELGEAAIAFKWSGHVGMTLDQIPHVGRLDERISFCLGYNGAGVAMSSLLGRHAAAFAAGEAPDVGLLDAARLKTIPFYPLREPAVRLVAGWYQLLDAVGR
jgi:glycine/D-amino acid oxidase-like deaminating enzyme